jgi:hypothetical protein
MDTQTRNYEVILAGGGYGHADTKSAAYTVSDTHRSMAVPLQGERRPMLTKGT